MQQLRKRQLVVREIGEKITEWLRVPCLSANYTVTFEQAAQGRKWEPLS